MSVKRITVESLVLAMFICLYVYMFICLYVYMFICLYVYMFICLYVYMFICFYLPVLPNPLDFRSDDKSSSSVISIGSKC
jgi:hypothetical protein